MAEKFATEEKSKLALLTPDEDKMRVQQDYTKMRPSSFYFDQLECVLCGFEAEDASEAEFHVRAVHTDAFFVSCVECGKIMANRRKMRKHLKQNH